MLIVVFVSLNVCFVCSVLLDKLIGEHVVLSSSYRELLGYVQYGCMRITLLLQQLSRYGPVLRLSLCAVCRIAMISLGGSRLLLLCCSIAWHLFPAV